MNSLTNKTVALITILFLFISLSNAQSVIFKNKLNETNYIEIHFFIGKKNIAYKSHKRIDIIYLKKLILKAKNRADLRCDTTGEITYFKNKEQLFKAYFCSRETGSKYNSTGLVIFQNGTTKTRALLNYGSAMLINEVYYKFNHRNN